jgi:hypothetical protein
VGVAAGAAAVDGAAGVGDALGAVGAEGGTVAGAFWICGLCTQPPNAAPTNSTHVAITYGIRVDSRMIAAQPEIRNPEDSIP